MIKHTVLGKNCTQDMVTNDHSYLDIKLSSTAVPPKEIFLQEYSKGWRPSSNSINEYAIVRISIIFTIDKVKYAS